jgi:nucleoside phosphorylase
MDKNKDQSEAMADDETPRRFAFPDISGEWAMEIHWQRDGKAGKRDATAFIRQGLEGINMAVRSAGSDSHTIMAQARRDETGGGAVLNYMYEVEPKSIGSDADGPYKGAAVLRFFPENEELSGNYWTSQLTKGHFKLNRKIDVAGASPLDTVDVLLITAIEEEFEAAKQAFRPTHSGTDGVPSWQDRPEYTNAPYWIGTFFCDAKPLFRMALAQSTRMGAIRTGQLATTLVERLGPKCLVMCGVCAGNPKDFALGDIVVSELAYQHDEGKVEKDGFAGDHRQILVSEAWQQAAARLRAEDLPSYGRPTERDSRYWLLERLHAGDDPKSHPARPRYFDVGAWRAMIEKLENENIVQLKAGRLRLTRAGVLEVKRSLLLDVDPPQRLPLAIKVGPIASGNVVVKDGLTWDKLKRMGVRTVAGLEMEAAALGQVARSFGVVDWIVIKGVMDYADPNKDDRYKPFAARASAEALRQFLVGRFLTTERKETSTIE